MPDSHAHAPLRLLLVGHGRMGRAIETLCKEHGFEVAGRLDSSTNLDGSGLDERWAGVDVAVDFSVGSAVPDNLAHLARLGIATVIGTTGWQEAETDLRALVDAAGIGVVAAPNCAPGVNAFIAIVERAAEVLGSRRGFEPWVHELHHAMKRDAPSGTAIALRHVLASRGCDPTLDIASTRAGAIPGTHTVGFDGPFETVTLTHATRDRRVFAQGALEAARWVHGRRGWFTMRHVLGLEFEGEESS